MSRPIIQSLPSDRGVSELVGVVLLFGIVIAGSMMIFVSGTGVMDDVRAESRVDSAETAFSSMDGTLHSLAHKQGSNRKTVDLGTVNPNNAEIRDTGELSVTINDNSACSASMDLSALEYQDDGGTTVAYEAGAIWQRTHDGLSVQKTPPIAFEQGSLQLEVIQLEGTVDSERMRVSYDRAESTDRTNEISANLFAEESCERPETVTITVDSDYYEGWAAYFADDMPDAATVTVDDGAGTTTVELDIDRDYDYIDFEGDGPGTVMWPSPGNDYIQTGSPTPLFSGVTDTGPGDTHNGSVTFLGAQNARLDSDEVEEEDEVVAINMSRSETVTVPLDGTVEVTVTDEYWEWDNETDNESQPPLEVAFVMDESGSMDGEKLDSAKQATHSFLDVMKADQGHRVALLGYSETWSWYEPDVRIYETFTEDQTAVENAIDELEAGGGTPIAESIRVTVREFEDNGDAENKQIMVLLTDGEETAGGDPVETAHEEIPDDVTVYTIGVGDDVNDDVLEEIAAAGADDSAYIKVENADELQETFEQIAKNETNRTTPRKVMYTENRTVTVDLTEVGPSQYEETITAWRNLSVDDPEMPGDTVDVTTNYSITYSTTASGEIEVERVIYGINETTTETVTREVSGTVSGSTDGEVGEEDVEVPESRVEDGGTRTVNVITWPAISMEMTMGADTVDLFGSQNVNVHGDGVDPGAFTNFEVDAGEEIHFDALFEGCADYSRTDDQRTIDGVAYNVTECASYGPELDRDATVHVFNNSSEISLPDSDAWQSDLEAMLTVDGTQYYTYEGGQMKAWNLDSNQVIVVVQAEDGDGSTEDANNVVLLVEVGNAKDDVSGEHLVNVQVRAVETEEDDD